MKYRSVLDVFELVFFVFVVVVVLLMLALPGW
jgi:hypothetical protein